MQSSLTSFLRDHMTGDPSGTGRVQDAVVIPVRSGTTLASTLAGINRSFDELERRFTRPEPTAARTTASAPRPRSAASHSSGSETGALAMIAGGLAAMVAQSLAQAYVALRGGRDGAVQHVKAAAHGIVGGATDQARTLLSGASKAAVGVSAATLRGTGALWDGVAEHGERAAGQETASVAAYQETAAGTTLTPEMAQPDDEPHIPDVWDEIKDAVGRFWRGAYATVRGWLFGLFAASDTVVNNAGGGGGGGNASVDPGTATNGPGVGLRAGGAHPHLGGGGDAETVDQTPAPPPGPPGTYRPKYSLTQGDVSDSVVAKIAGEAQHNQNSVDAVINNMLNRVGTKGYGPSASIAQVAFAPGQYAAPLRHVDPKWAAAIRARIQAITSGEVPDNTHGSNEYRASYYHGQWYQHHANAPVYGGNRYAYNPKAGRGTYAAFEHPNLPVAPSANADGGADAPKSDGAPKAERVPSPPVSQAAPAPDAPATASARRETPPAIKASQDGEVGTDAAPPLTVTRAPRSTPDVQPTRAQDDAPVPADKGKGGGSGGGDNESKSDKTSDAGHSDADSDLRKHAALVSRHIHDAGAGMLVIGAHAYS